MRVAFYIGNSGFYEWLVRTITGSPTHCELVFSDDVWCSSSNRDGGTRFKKIKPADGSWVFIDVTGIDQDKVRSFCNAQVAANKGYDYLGVLFWWNKLNNPFKWFCSELVTRALQEGGMPLKKAACTMTPNSLYRYLSYAYKIDV